MAKKAKSRPSLEREVIGAVVILYLLICGVMLAIHYMQPTGQQTRSSSRSPSHEALRTGDLTGPQTPGITQVDAHTKRQDGSGQPPLR